MCPMVSRPLSIELALLGYLRHGARHGYQIHDLLQDPQGLGAVWRVKQAQLYALLSKLEQAGYLDSSLLAQETRPARRMYALNAKGVAAYLKWIALPVGSPRQLRQEFQAKLYFAQGENPAAAKQLINAQRQACLAWLAKEEELMTAAGLATFPYSVHLFRVGQLQAMLDWLDACLEMIG